MLKLEKSSKDQNTSAPSNDFDGVIDGFIYSFLEKIAGFLFRKIDFDNISIQTLREYAEKKNIVYLSFHSSNISLLILCHLLKKHKIDIPIVALEENPYLMQTIKHIWRRIIRFFNKLFLRKEYTHIFDTDYIERKLGEGKSILISLLSRKFFLRRYTEIKYDSLIYLINLQKNIKDPIYLLPQMIFWNLNPERTRRLMASQATGDRGLISGWITVLKSATPAFLRILPPIDLHEQIINSYTDDSEQIAIDLRNKLLEMSHHEKRSVLGPVIRSKQEMMEKVLYHKEVLDAIEKQSGREKTTKRKLRRKAYYYFKEIAANYSVVVISIFKVAIEFILNKIFDGIQYDPESISRIREASKKGPLILVPNHRSSIDYFIISYLFYINKLVCPHIAAGKNLFFFPSGPILRHSGAFSIRRSFIGLNKMYPAVFKQYLRTLVSDGYSIEVFMEGTRTRTGKMRLPKLGVLYYLIEAIYEGYNDDLVFVPISIDYDRILEEKSYLKELNGHEKENESISSVIQSRKFLKRKYGRVYVSFSEPFTLKEVAPGLPDIKKVPDLVASTISAKISEVTVVTPFALTTSAILILSRKGFSESRLKEISGILFSYLNRSNARFSETLHENTDMDMIINHVIESFLSDNILHEIRIEGGNKEEVVEDLFALKDENRTRISYYKNCIVHYFIPVSFTSISIMNIARNSNEKLIASVKEPDVKEEYNFIKDLFRREFLYCDDDGKGAMINELVYHYFTENSILSRDDKGNLLLNENKIDDIKLFSSIFKDHFESYYIVLKTVLDIKSEKYKRSELINNIRKQGLKMYHTGEIDLAESLSIPNYNNAVSRFGELGILKGGARELNNGVITVSDLEKAEEFLSKIKNYLKILE